MLTRQLVGIVVNCSPREIVNRQIGAISKGTTRKIKRDHSPCHGMERGQYRTPGTGRNRPLSFSKMGHSHAEVNGGGGLQTHIRIAPFSPVRHDPTTASARPRAEAVSFGPLADSK